MITHYPLWDHKSFLYEQLLFSGGAPISQPAPEMRPQLRYFRPNVKLPLEETGQPKRIQIHVFTTSGSEKFNLDEVTSMVIEPSTSNCGLDLSDDPEFEYFLEYLSPGRLKNLKNFKLFGFEMTKWLWDWLYSLNLDWVHYTPPHKGGCFDSLPQHLAYMRLHMNLGERLDLSSLPSTPRSVKELSLHISNPLNSKYMVTFYDCINLEKM